MSEVPVKPDKDISGAQQEAGLRPDEQLERAQTPDQQGEEEGQSSQTEMTASQRRFWELSDSGVIRPLEDPVAFIHSIEKILVRSDMHGEAGSQLAREWIGEALSSFDEGEKSRQRMTEILSKAKNSRVIDSEAVKQLAEEYDIELNNSR